MRRILHFAKFLLLLSFLMTVSASSRAAILMQDDFDPDVDSSQWSAIVGGIVDDSPMGEYNDGNALRFNGTSERTATTYTLDVSTGGMAEFVLKFGDSDDTLDFEDADPGEDVVFEYSTDGGTNWSNLETFDTEDSEFEDVFGQVAIPVAAQTNATMFRWRQIAFNGSVDNWAIDDVKITSTDVNIIPEPSSCVTFAGLALCFGLAGWWRRRRRRA